MITHAFNALAFLCCGYALVRGGAPERIGALIAIAGIFATIATGRHHYARMELDVLLVDAAVYLAFQLLAFSADRFWPTMVSGFQMTTVLMHLVTGAMPDFIPFAYALAIWTWSLFVILLIAGGTWRHRRRLGRYGSDRDWSLRSSTLAGVSAHG